jgi:hypothetical protein
MRRNDQRCALEWRLAFVTAVGLLALSGCSGVIVGDWHLLRAMPNKEMFAIDDAHFDRDGSFVATVTLDGSTTQERGTYKFNGYQLILRPAAGGQRKFGAVRKIGTLEVSRGSRLVVLKKGKK